MKTSSLREAIQLDVENGMLLLLLCNLVPYYFVMFEEISLAVS
jgi:hypothetical protein